MKKWIPFVLILGLALLLSFNLLFFGQKDYIPASSDPSVIYREACRDCHGDSSQPADLWSPELKNEVFLFSEVRQIVREGSWRMPAFPLIPDSTLDSLVYYVVEFNNSMDGK